MFQKVKVLFHWILAQVEHHLTVPEKTAHKDKYRYDVKLCVQWICLCSAEFRENRRRSAGKQQKRTLTDSTQSRFSLTSLNGKPFQLLGVFCWLSSGWRHSSVQRRRKTVPTDRIGFEMFPPAVLDDELQQTHFTHSYNRIYNLYKSEVWISLRTRLYHVTLFKLGQWMNVQPERWAN